MQILSRFMIVLVLLGGLAYGSYAFGKYVLSAHLLNESPVKSDAGEAVKRSTRAAEAVTRQTDYQGTQPKVELKVLPAGDDGEGPAPPPRRSLVQHSEERTYARPPETPNEAAAEKVVESEAQRADKIVAAAERNTRTSDNSTSDDGSSTSTRRHRGDSEDTRRASRIENNPFADLGVSGAKPNADSPVSGGGVYRGDGADGDMPRKKRRKRKPVTDAAASTKPDSGGSMVPMPEGETPRTRHHATVITDSPVPVPEGGGESPVPQPEQ